MKFVGIEKKEQGKFITRYDVQYETVDGIVKNYEMISRNGESPISRDFMARQQMRWSSSPQTRQMRESL